MARDLLHFLVRARGISKNIHLFLLHSCFHLQYVSNPAEKNFSHCTQNKKLLVASDTHRFDMQIVSENEGFIQLTLQKHVWTALSMIKTKIHFIYYIIK